MFKCKHTKTGDKFTYSKKYSEDILIEYTYCIKCGAILNGRVSFVDKKEITSEEKSSEHTNAPTNVLLEGNGDYLNMPTEDELKIEKTSQKINKPKTKSKKKKIIKTEKRDSNIRDNSRKPSSEQLPDGVSLGDILRAKYKLEGKTKTSTKKSTKKKTPKKQQSKSKFTEMDSDAFDESDDLDIFIK